MGSIGIHYQVKSLCISHRCLSTPVSIGCDGHMGEPVNLRPSVDAMLWAMSVEVKDTGT